jgi:hypothetical protein
MLISLHSFGSIQTLRTPQFSTDAASRFCSFSEIPMAAAQLCLAQPAYGLGAAVKGRAGRLRKAKASRRPL